MWIYHKIGSSKRYRLIGGVTDLYFICIILRHQDRYEIIGGGLFGRKKSLCFELVDLVPSTYFNDDFYDQTSHMLCVRMVAAVGVIVISVNYRLAPKHRLPATYDDCLTTLSWLYSKLKRTNNDNERDEDIWLQSHIDFYRVFLVGDSLTKKETLRINIETNE